MSRRGHSKGGGKAKVAHNMARFRKHGGRKLRG